MTTVLREMYFAFHIEQGDEPQQVGVTTKGTIIRQAQSALVAHLQAVAYEVNQYRSYVFGDIYIDTGISTIKNTTTQRIALASEDPDMLGRLERVILDIAKEGRHELSYPNPTRRQISFTKLVNLMDHKTIEDLQNFLKRP